MKKAEKVVELFLKYTPEHTRTIVSKNITLSQLNKL